MQTKKRRWAITVAVLAAAVASVTPAQASAGAVAHSHISFLASWGEE
jgi:hypothetical protein